MTDVLALFLEVRHNYQKEFNVKELANEYKNKEKQEKQEKNLKKIELKNILLNSGLAKKKAINSLIKTKKINMAEKRILKKRSPNFSLA